jgi:starch-binding outer membrane protein, SusD/RagB family
MRKILTYIISSVLLSGSLFSCHNLDVPITTQLTPDVFPQTPTQFVSASGPVYVALRGNWSTEYFFQQSFSTDEGIMPARGGNWFDGGQNMQMHYHSWTKDNGYVNGNWGWLATTIGVANQTLSILNSTEPAGAAKNTNIAEIKLARAFTFFMLMDNYGNVPIDTLYGDFTPRPNTPRAKVFEFIESEVKKCIPYLSTTVDVSTYGRPTVYMAYALLAKMYINAEYYTGTAKYNECIAACDNIINSGKFAIASKDNYLKMFYYNNGPTSPGSKEEFIFAIPFDATSSGFLGRSANYKARYDVPRSMGKVADGAGFNFFNIPYTPGGPASTLPEFYANFNDPNDVRNKQWLTGLQFKADGVTPIMVTTTKAGYDAIAYPGDKTAYTYQVNLTPNILLRQSESAFDCGNDEVAWNMGYRNIKFYPDPTSASRNQNNDEPVFRYADIILEKAEAIQRGGTATSGQTALSLVNLLRANRTTSPALTSIKLDDILSERNRELAWEGWSRNDVIRFGKFESKWGYKTNSETYRRIFPIPTSALVLNPSLTQNPGY